MKTDQSDRTPDAGRADIADAYRDRRIYFELGEEESKSLLRDSRRGCLSLIAAEKFVADSRIAKRRRKDRAVWIGELSYLLSSAGVDLAALDARGIAGWRAFFDSKYADLRPRPDRTGERVFLTPAGKRFLAQHAGDFGRAWVMSSRATEWFVCSLLSRLVSVHVTGASRRRDVVASAIAAGAARSPKGLSDIVIAAEVGERPMTGAQRGSLEDQVSVDLKIVGV